jgi:uncharacterized protein (TIGR00730 family)
MRSVAVFCGSNLGAVEAYAEGAHALGTTLARRGLGLIFGGTHKGLMGVVAEACMKAGGTVTGVITHGLAARGHTHPALTRIELVPDIATRKRTMAALADAYVVLPGGIGTLEELFEVWVHSQLEQHMKPIGLLDLQGYFAPLLRCVDHMVEQRFLPAAHREMLVVEKSPDDLLDRFATHRPVGTPKWL